MEFIILNYLKTQLYKADSESLKATVEKAVSEHAYLRGADLSGADLSGADLSGAYLRGADLSGADLRSAYLSGANGFHPSIVTPLLMLHDQIGKIRGYKLVNSEHEGPFKGGIKYKVGQSYEVDNANTDVNDQCGAGINLATLDWCLKNRHEADKPRILIAEFEAKDIAAIPTGTDGKFRVHRCTIVAEKDISDIIASLDVPPEKESA